MLLGWRCREHFYVCYWYGCCVPRLNKVLFWRQISTCHVAFANYFSTKQGTLALFWRKMVEIPKIILNFFFQNLSWWFLIGSVHTNTNGDLSVHTTYLIKIGQLLATSFGKTWDTWHYSIINVYILILIIFIDI